MEKEKNRIVSLHFFVIVFLVRSLMGPNAANIHVIADLYAEVLGGLATSRFLSIKRRFFAELRELR